MTHKPKHPAEEIEMMVPPRSADQSVVDAPSGAITSVSPAECYTVRNGFGWANIFVQHGIGTQGNGDPRYWVHLSIISDFGNYGYCWSHIGCDWRAFLTSLNFDYAMQKMAGRYFEQPLSVDDCIVKSREFVLDMRRDRQMTAGDARALWDALDEGICTEQLPSPESFLHDLDRLSGGAMYRAQMWDMRWREPSPEARGFWREIWPHFLAAIADGAYCASTTDGTSGPGRNSNTPDTAQSHPGEQP